MKKSLILCTTLAGVYLSAAPVSGTVSQSVSGVAATNLIGTTAPAETQDEKVKLIASKLISLMNKDARYQGIAGNKQMSQMVAACVDYSSAPEMAAIDNSATFDEALKAMKKYSANRIIKLEGKQVPCAPIIESLIAQPKVLVADKAPEAKTNNEPQNVTVKNSKSYGTTNAQNINFKNNESISVDISSVDANRIVVKGDKIVSVSCMNNACTAKNLPDGSAYLTVNNNMQKFSAFINTEQGRYVALFLDPKAMPGKTIILHADQAGQKQPEWEKNSPYEDILVKLTDAMKNGGQTEGYSQVPMTGKSTTVSFASQLTIEPLRQYIGTKLKGVVYKVTNTTDKPAQIKPYQFYDHGVRSVSLSSNFVAPHGYIFAYIIFSGDSYDR